MLMRLYESVRNVRSDLICEYPICERELICFITILKCSEKDMVETVVVFRLLIHSEQLTLNPTEQTSTNQIGGEAELRLRGGIKSVFKGFRRSLFLAI